MARKKKTPQTESLILKARIVFLRKDILLASTILLPKAKVKLTKGYIIILINIYITIFIFIVIFIITIVLYSIVSDLIFL